MTRWISPLNDANAAQTAIALVTLAELSFDSGTLYVHDGYSTLQWNGNTYSGLGDYGSVDTILENTDSTAQALQMTLSGVPSSLVNTAMTEHYQGRQVTLYVGMLDINSMEWVDDPQVVWEGRMDYMTIDIGEQTSTMRMNCENRLNREPLIARYTDQDQQLAHPGDKFFDLTWQISLATATWGAVSIQHPGSQNGGFGTTPVTSPTMNPAYQRG